MLKQLHFFFIASIFSQLLATSSFASPDAEIWSFWNTAEETNTTAIDHSLWQSILESYVAPEPGGINLFAYSRVSATDRDMLTDYLKKMQGIDPRRYSRAEQQAYWINLYNALTVNLILENYPTESITDLGESFFSFGPWDDEIATIAEQTLSLNDIEHRILRPIWQDPRIHFAVNCASIGCPNLQAKAFTGENLERLMDKSATEYLAHPRAARIVAGKLILSSIFDWYGKDFGKNRLAQLIQISEYAPAEKATELRKFRGRIDFEYDWALNSAD